MLLEELIQKWKQYLWLLVVISAVLPDMIMFLAAENQLWDHLSESSFILCPICKTVFLQ